MYLIKISTLLTTVLFLMSSAGWADNTTDCSGLSTQWGIAIANGKTAEADKLSKAMAECQKRSGGGDLSDKECRSAGEKYREERQKANEACTKSGVSNCTSTAIKCATANTKVSRSGDELSRNVMSALGALAPQMGGMLTPQQYENNCSNLNMSDWDKRETVLKGRLKDFDTRANSLHDKIQTAAEDKASKQTEMLGDMNDLVSKMDEERQKAKEEQRSNDLKFAEETHRAADAIRNMEMKQIEIQGNLLEVSIKRGSLSSGLAGNLLECRMKYEAAQAAALSKPGHGQRVHSGLSGASQGASQDSDVQRYKLCLESAKSANDSGYKVLAQQEKGYQKSLSDLQSSLAEQKDMMQKQGAAAAERLKEFSDLQVSKEKTFYQKQQNLITKFNSTTQLADQKVATLSGQVTKLRFEEIQDTNAVNLLGERPTGDTIPRDSLIHLQAAKVLEDGYLTKTDSNGNYCLSGTTTNIKGVKSDLDDVVSEDQQENIDSALSGKGNK